MNSPNLTKLTIKETADLLAKGDATSAEVTRAYLQRIDRLNPKLNAYLTVFHDTAAQEAKVSDERRSQGKLLGILDGMPLALKDNISTMGQRTTAGSKILDSYEPLYDASVVKKLRQLGAVILGKTNMDEFAMGSSTENSAYGATLNPWDTGRVPGGSSGGSSVAVAANLCAGALGSDTGGSIRQPAAFCGVTGLKPTYGRVSRYGLLAMASSLDQIGPLTKNAEDAAILLEAISGSDVYDSTTLGGKKFNLADDRRTVDDRSEGRLDGLKIGRPKEYFGTGIDGAVARLIADAIARLQTLGAQIKEVSLPHSPAALAAYYVIMPVEVASNLARYDGIRYGESIEREAGTPAGTPAGAPDLRAVYQDSRSRYLGEEVKRRIMLGTYASSAGYYDAYYTQALKVRSLLKQEFEAVFTQVDLMVTPVTPTPAFKLGEKSRDPLAMYLADINTVPVNLAGLPAISIPCGFVDKLPVGLQLIGAPLGEEKILQAALAYQAATGWHKQQPILEEN